MLVISRRKGQVITIGDNIEVVVTEVHRSSVKLGIVAPKTHVVMRKEAAEKAAMEASAHVEAEAEAAKPAKRGPPPAKGDLLRWRKQKYTVKAVHKWTIQLQGELNDVTVRCLRPIAEGGFDEARILKRA